MIRGAGRLLRATVIAKPSIDAINTATPVVAINGKVSVQAVTSAAAPTAGTDILAGMSMVWKNSTDSTVKLYYNDAGTFKTVALA